jgi:hypothetical protein
VTEWIRANFAHVLFVLVLVARLGDVFTTRLITPGLTLEANPLVRKLGWPFAAATVLVCLVPYYSTALGVTVLVPSLLISASNASRVWTARTLGEQEYANLLRQLARRSTLAAALLPAYAGAAFVLIVGLLLCFLCPDPEREWGYWFGLGIVLYGLVVAVYGTLGIRRVFREARETGTSG